MTDRVQVIIETIVRDSNNYYQMRQAVHGWMKCGVVTIDNHSYMYMVDIQASLIHSRRVDAADYPNEQIRITSKRYTSDKQYVIDAVVFNDIELII